MTVKTKTVTGRRDVSLKSYDDLLAEVDRLTSGGETKMLGNWTLGQIFEHVANSLNACLAGFTFKAPFFMRLIAGTFMKKKFIYGGIPAGFQIPKSGAGQFTPDPGISTEQAAAELRQAIQRVKSATPQQKHPIFGALTRDQWENFNLRHAETHLSFAIPSKS